MATHQVNDIVTSRYAVSDDIFAACPLSRTSLLAAAIPRGRRRLASNSSTTRRSNHAECVSRTSFFRWRRNDPPHATGRRTRAGHRSRYPWEVRSPPLCRERRAASRAQREVISPRPREQQTSRLILTYIATLMMTAGPSQVHRKPSRLPEPCRSSYRTELATHGTDTR